MLYFVYQCNRTGRCTAVFLVDTIKMQDVMLLISMAIILCFDLGGGILTTPTSHWLKLNAAILKLISYI